MTANLNDGITLLLGIVIEAFPFIFLGSLVASLIRIFVNPEKLLKILPKNKLGICIISSLIGMFFPVCECGNVPVAKQLLEKKLPLGSSISFLLGAPILNPIVITTTIIAFPQTPIIWWGRIGLGFLIAVLVGHLFSFASSQEALNKKNPAKNSNCHSHQHCNCAHQSSTWQNLIQHLFTEFVNMFSVLIFGAFLAALMQTFFPREIILSIASSPLLAILAMMSLAFVISICSTTDAFFILAYTHQFSTASILAFLVFGPMIDIKALMMMKTVYKTKILIYLVLLIGLLVLTSTYFLDTFWLQ